jgi:hypothetical protein
MFKVSRAREQEYSVGTQGVETKKDHYIVDRLPYNLVYSKPRILNENVKLCIPLNYRRKVVKGPDFETTEGEAGHVRAQ